MKSEKPTVETYKVLSELSVLDTAFVVLDMAELQAEDAENFLDKYDDKIRIKKFLNTIKHLLWATDSILVGIRNNITNLTESEV